LGNSGVLSFSFVLEAKNILGIWFKRKKEEIIAILPLLFSALDILPGFHVPCV